MYTCEIEYTVKIKASVDSFCVGHKEATAEAMRYGEDDIIDTLMKYMQSDDTTIENVEVMDMRVLSCEPNIEEN